MRRLCETLQRTQCDTVTNKPLNILINVEKEENLKKKKKRPTRKRKGNPKKQQLKEAE